MPLLRRDIRIFKKINTWSKHMFIDMNYGFMSQEEEQLVKFPFNSKEARNPSVLLNVVLMTSLKFFTDVI